VHNRSHKPSQRGHAMAGPAAGWARRGSFATLGLQLLDVNRRGIGKSQAEWTNTPCRCGCARPGARAAPPHAGPRRQTAALLRRRAWSTASTAHHSGRRLQAADPPRGAPCPRCPPPPPPLEHPSPVSSGRGRCVSIFFGKNRRGIGKSQSKRPPSRTHLRCCVTGWARRSWRKHGAGCGICGCCRARRIVQGQPGLT
jgi:hypothetical protein